MRLNIRTVTTFIFVGALAGCSGRGGVVPGGTPQSGLAESAQSGDAAPPGSLQSVLGGRTAGSHATADLGSPTYDGCPVFPSGDSAYNQEIYYSAVDPRSANYMASFGTNHSWDMDTAEYLNLSPGSPVIPVKSQVPWHVMPPQPWKSTFKIEALSDAHSFVLSTGNCHINELYNTQYNGVLSAYSGGDWDLKAPFVPKPLGTSSAVASGISMFAGAVKYSEILNGATPQHALFLIVPYNSLAQWQFVRPASSTDGIPYKGIGPYQLPYGAKLRLVWNYPNAPGPQATSVIRALKVYGAIVGDTGCCFKLVFMNDLNTPNAFNYSDLQALSAIKATDFRVMTLPTIYTVPGH